MERIMSYSYARINLEKTNYKKMQGLEYHARIIEYYPNMPKDLDVIYYKYCRHHKFNSVMPLFPIEYEENTIIGYFDTNHDGLYNDYHNYNDPLIMVGFSMICEFDNKNAECYQFAWDYRRPKLQLGIASLKHECAYYKAKGFKYLYIGGADEYKCQLDGLEIVGPVAWIDGRWTIDGFEKLPGK
tara:strand:+ start:734 stop:1288 length:555 start_codon:yes stop_codon:yes gene_type:complete